MEVSSLQFDSVLVYRKHDLKENWQEGLHDLEEIELNQEVYKNGPVFFSCTDDAYDRDKGAFTYYLPINQPVGVREDAEIQYLEQVQIDKALTLRQADQETNFSAAYEKVKKYAERENIALSDTYYCVMLDVYGEIMIDLYVPLAERSEVS
ncbi:DUF5085 family protein [Fictibacillus sp. UD]|uniref:DUF5085 family protein n=1 Tax=Fictibacillus sp. UD TaxID=3038777 RepID=UPI0037452DA9